jgi:hypothetical protein
MNRLFIRDKDYIILLKNWDHRTRKLRHSNYKALPASLQVNKAEILPKAPHTKVYSTDDTQLQIPNWLNKLKQKTEHLTKN